MNELNNPLVNFLFMGMWLFVATPFFGGLGGLSIALGQIKLKGKKWPIVLGIVFFVIAAVPLVYYVAMYVKFH